MMCYVLRSTFIGSHFSNRCSRPFRRSWVDDWKLDAHTFALRVHAAADIRARHGLLLTLVCSPCCTTPENEEEAKWVGRVRKNINE